MHSIFRPEETNPFCKLLWKVYNPHVTIWIRGRRFPSSRWSAIIFKTLRSTFEPSEEIWIRFNWSSVASAFQTSFSAFAPCKNSEMTYRVSTTFLDSSQSCIEKYIWPIQSSRLKFSSFDMTWKGLVLNSFGKHRGKQVQLVPYISLGSDKTSNLLMLLSGNNAANNSVIWSLEHFENFGSNNF